MKLRLPEVKIDIVKDGFDKHCELGRKETGEKLSKLLDAVSDPLVVAVDGPWGSGKTHFLKCWVGAHKNEFGGKAKVIYFDAFEHDYLDDPLVALTLALEEELGLNEDSEENFKKLKKAAIIGGKLVARMGLVVATSGVSEITGAVLSAATSFIGKEGDKLIEQLWEKEKGRISAMSDFGEALKSLTNTGKNNETKLIIVIDELDRCRPDYALLLLEIIKHFFAIKNIKFVLGVNLQELANSVEARYGKNVDSNSYLQKFIDIRLKLETSLNINKKDSVPGKYFEIVAQKQGLNSKKYKNAIDGYLENWGSDCPLTLREIERLVTAAVLTPTTPNNQIGKWILIGGLLIIKIQNPELFQKIRIGSASFEEVCEYFNLPTKIDENTHSLKKDLATNWYYLLNNKFLIESTKNDALANYGHLSEEDTLHSSIFKHYLDVFESEALVEKTP